MDWQHACRAAHAGAESVTGHFFAEVSIKRKRLLLFDVDGTLVSTASAGVRSLRATLKNHYGISDDLTDIEVAGKTDRAIIRDILRKHRIDQTAESIDEFANSYLSGLAAELPQRDGQVLPGILTLLERLKPQPHIVLALLTGNLARGARMKLDHFGLWHYFEFGAFADDHHDRNELGAFARRRAQEKHGHEFDAADIDVIGDTGHDVACGKVFGARTIAVATGGWSYEALEKTQPDCIFRDFSDVNDVIATLDW